MTAFVTSPVVIGDGAAQAAREYIFENFGARDNILVVCDTNTEAIAVSELQGADRYVFPGDVIADPDLIPPLEVLASGKKALVAVGSGTVHDLTRYCAHKMGLQFISFPTTASVDGFVSGIAAMTVGGQKLSFPSAPPAALFAEPAVFMSAPPALTAAGVGDMLGKYISLFDWEVSTAVTGERFDAQIYALERDALDRLIAVEPGSQGFGVLLMQALVTSGLAIQAYGSSRPASGSEHHLSHLWEMHCINEPVPALHGEKVGVATLLLLGRYRALERFRLKNNVYELEYLLPVFGRLTDGIIRENMPDPLEGLTQERLDEISHKLRKIVSGLPDPEFVKSYMKACGCKTAIASLGLPDTPEFIGLTLEFAPYVRRRVTMLKLCGIC